MVPLRFIGALLGGAILASAVANHAVAETVNVYSYRQPFLIEPMLDAFTKKTGIEVKVVFAKNGVIERLKAEGVNSPADVLLTVDIGRLNDAIESDVVQPVKSAVLAARIPASFRDPDNRWFGLTSRARIIYASKDRVKPGEITSYEQLADPMWKGRICTRGGKHVYNVALFAAMIAHHGEAKAEAWLRGVKANLARKPQGNDRAQVKAIHEGECDLAIGNNYYYGNMLDTAEQKPWADSVNLVFPTIGGGKGTHVNLAGVALAKAAPNRANGIKLMEFLAGDEAQSLYAERNYEYPVNPAVAWSKKVESWGHFIPDDLSLAAIAELRGDAIRMVDRVDYDG
ncbi:MAG: Fe(3+) ABC transporter substrate-binding protein [Alphaproteobacteria bacterium]|nr:Fe(3+) ABC transporter substrate-binding protein [Alphaproteobacteria bacterium]